MNNTIIQKNYLQLILILTISITVLILFWNILPENLRTNESSDYTMHYEPIARNILAGRGIVDKEGRIAIIIPPVFPLLLSMNFLISRILGVSEEFILSIFILVFTSMSSILVYLIAKLIWCTKYALITAFIWLTYPLILWLTKQPNSEIPFLFFFYSSLYCFWYSLIKKKISWIHLFASGILIGIAMMIRPIVIGMGFILTILFYFSRKDIKVNLRLFFSLIILFGNFCIVTPWIIKVYKETGKIILLSANGNSIIRNGLTYYLQNDRFHHKPPKEVIELMEDIDKRKHDMNSLVNTYHILKEEFQKRPLIFIKIIGIKMLRCWYGTNSMRFEKYVICIQLPYLSLILMSILFSLRQKWKIKIICFNLVIFIIYFWGITTLGLSILRYMVPIISLTFILFPVLLFVLPSTKNMKCLGNEKSYTELTENPISEET